RRDSSGLRNDASAFALHDFIGKVARISCARRRVHISSRALANVIGAIVAFAPDVRVKRPAWTERV
ncbi:MAG: hypothetical protein ABW133_17715, partial [Polyangiaceae bacterium]